MSDKNGSQISAYAAHILDLTTRKAVERQEQHAIGTEHLLLALITFRPALAATALGLAGLGYDRIGAVEQRISALSVAGGDNSGKKAASLELREVLHVAGLLAQYDDRDVGAPDDFEITDLHLLRGLFYVREYHGSEQHLNFHADCTRLGAKIIRDMGVDPLSLRRIIAAMQDRT